MSDPAVALAYRSAMEVISAAEPDVAEAIVVSSREPKLSTSKWKPSFSSPNRLDNLLSPSRRSYSENQGNVKPDRVDQWA